MRVALAILVTGLLLIRVVGFFELKAPATRAIVYWLHVICPLFVVWLYWLHRLAGRRIKWRIGIGYAVAVGAIALVMVYLQSQDPRDWYAQAPKEGETVLRAVADPHAKRQAHFGRNADDGRLLQEVPCRRARGLGEECSTT